MITFILALSPLATSLLTGLMKKLPAFTSLTGSARTAGVRALAALIAVAYIVLGFYVTGNLDSTAFGAAVQTFLFAFFAWIGSLGVFHAFVQQPATPQA